MQEAVAVEPAGRELTARGVEREGPVAGDTGTAFDEGPALARPAELQRLEPEHGQVAEPVIDLGDVDVGRGEVGAAPHLRRGIGADNARSGP